MKTLKLLLLIAALTTVCLVYSTDTEAKISGKCGENATFIDDGKGTMEISGSGKVDSLPVDSNVANGSSEEIKKLVINEGITEINYSSTKVYLKMLEEVKLPTSIRDINGTFSHTSIKSIVLPEGITVIDDEAFAGCYELESITLGEKTTEIGKKAFYNCTSLKEITIPKTVAKIGGRILEHADNLMKVDNQSAQIFPLPTKRLGAYPLWQTFFVDGKKTTEVPAGKVVLGKWNSYKVTLKLSGGKLVGKRISKHTYNSSEKLPKAKKKGYVFFGWKLKSSYFGITVEKIRKTISKPTVYKAIFKKVTKKKTGNKTTITLKNPKIEDCNSNLHIKVFSNKKASKNATTFVLNLDKKGIAKKAGIVCKYLPKKNKVEIKVNNKNAKKVKVYWGDDGDTESELFSKEYSINV